MQTEALISLAAAACVDSWQCVIGTPMTRHTINLRLLFPPWFPQLFLAGRINIYISQNNPRKRRKLGASLQRSSFSEGGHSAFHHDPSSRVCKFMSCKSRTPLQKNSLMHNICILRLAPLQKKIQQFVTENPVQAATLLSGIAAIAAPLAIAGSFLGVLGFGAGGVVAGMLCHTHR
jgi:hypothetical protein